MTGPATTPDGRSLIPARCWCGHPKDAHADCGVGPCRSNVALALWHDSDDRKVTPCRCRSFHEPIETEEVEG